MTDGMIIDVRDYRPLPGGTRQVTTKFPAMFGGLCRF